MLQLFNRRKTGDLVVRPRMSSRTKLMLAVGIVSAIVFTTGGIYNYGLSMAGFARTSAAERENDLQQEIKRLTADNQQLREALARSEHSIKMNQTAFQELDRSLQSSAQEIVRLREELHFYRNIISPSDKRAGLRVQNLAIERSGKNQYRYKLVLIQALRHERVVYGSASLAITGLSDGKEAIVRIPDRGDRGLAVNLRYFQDIEGQFELPQNFKPKEVRVVVTPSGGTHAIEETYAWPQGLG